jgi:O-antigen/teichoic acid export membrane protein
VSEEVQPEPQKPVGLIARIREVGARPVVRNTIYYGINFGLQVLTQFGFFALISRVLGPSGYGIFASVSAIALMVSVFVGLGSDHLLIQRIAVNRDAFASYFGRALAMMLMTFAPAMMLAFAVLYFLDTGTFSFWGLFCILAAECVFRKISFLCSATYMAHDRAGKQFAVDNAIMILRFLAVAVLTLTTDTVDLDTWALWYACASLLASGVSLTMVLKDYGLPGPIFSGFEFRQGFLLSLEFTSVSGMRDLDKPVVVELLGPAQAGIYTAAFRIIDAATTPVKAALYATYTRYFRHADKGAEHGIAFGLRVLPVISGLGLLVAVFIVLIAGYVPLLLGAEYEETVGLIRLLAIYPLLLGAAGIGADIMRSIGMQGTRVILVFVSNFVIVGVVWAGCNLGALEGAVLSRMALQAGIVALTWGLIGRKKSQVGATAGSSKTTD